MLDAKTYMRIARASAAYDLVVTAAFATPWTFLVIHSLVVWLDHALTLPGAVPPPDTLVVLMANLMGSLVVVWSLTRLRLNLAVLGRYDAAARFLFAAWQAYALGQGMSFIVVPLLIMELVFGILQLLPVREGQGDLNK